jgi:tetratricopeptide (TPR) repeat protein
MRLVPVLLLALLVAPCAYGATPVEQATALLVAKDPAAAAAITALVKAQPDSAEAHILMARLQLRQGKADDAIDSAEEAVDLDPGSAQAHYWLGNAYGSRIGQVGMLSQAMMAPKLRDAFERAVALDPNLNDARGSLVDFYLQAPAVAGGSVEKARAQTQELLKRDPPRGQFALGRIAMYEKKPAEAAKAFAAASAAKPDDVSYRMAAGVALQETKQWDAAFDLFEAWTRKDPKAAMAWYQVGRTSALSGQRLDVGAAALKTFMGLPPAPNLPTAANAQYRLGQVQAHAGDKAAAKASFQAALKGDPDNADVKAALAAL